MFAVHCKEFTIFLSVSGRLSCSPVNVPNDTFAPQHIVHFVQVISPIGAIIQESGYKGGGWVGHVKKRKGTHNLLEGMADNQDVKGDDGA